MAHRCPKEGTRVRFVMNPAAAMLYRERGLKSGHEGSITTLPVPGGRRTCMPGPRGGMVYVDWDDWGTIGVFKADLVTASGKQLAGPAKRRRR